MGARAYNSTEGRFLSVDSIEGGCANAYVYAYGDPLNSSDLTGQSGCKNDSPTSPDSIASDAATGTAEGLSIASIINDSTGLAIAGIVAGFAGAVVDTYECTHGSEASCVNLILDAGATASAVAAYLAAKAADEAAKSMKETLEGTAQGATILSLIYGTAAAGVTFGSEFTPPTPCRL